MVRDEQNRSYQGKHGQVNLVELTLLDVGSVPQLKNTVDYVLAETEASYKGTLMGKTITVGVREIETAFGGRLRMKGQILTVAK